MTRVQSEAESACVCDILFLSGYGFTSPCHAMPCVSPRTTLLTGRRWIQLSAAFNEGRSASAFAFANTPCHACMHAVQSRIDFTSRFVSPLIKTFHKPTAATAAATRFPVQSPSFDSKQPDPTRPSAALYITPSAADPPLSLSHLSSPPRTSPPSPTSSATREKQRRRLQTAIQGASPSFRYPARFVWNVPMCIN